MIRKLFICPWFGQLPSWMPYYLADIERLRAFGYEWLIDHDLNRFAHRCNERLGVEPPEMWGTGKIHDYRACLGVLYREEIAGYDFWGHTDFDVAYGNPSHFATDELLASLDVYTDGWDYINGPWTLYRNTAENANIFRDHDVWEDVLEHPDTFGWVEKGYTEHVKARVGERLLIRNDQARNLNDFGSVKRDGDALYESEREILLAHFRRTKSYPVALRI